MRLYINECHVVRIIFQCYHRCGQDLENVLIVTVYGSIEGEKE